VWPIDFYLITRPRQHFISPANNGAVASYTSVEASVTRPARYLLGTIVVGILVLVLCALALRRPASTNPFDQPAPSAATP
jgi:hypothetical protein